MADMADMPAGAAGLTSRVLAQMAPATAPGQELQLVRVEVAPGATVAAHSHPGTMVLCLESGSVLKPGDCLTFDAMGQSATTFLRTPTP